MKKIVIILLFLGNVIQMMGQDSGTYQIKFLEINKENSDYAVAMLDDNKLVFTSAGESVSKNRNYNPRKELFIGEIDMKGEVVNIHPAINKENNKFNTTGVAYTNNKKTVYFSRNKYIRKRSKQKQPKNKRLELYKADVDAEGNWTNIQKLPFNDDKYSTGYPALNRDNTKLYFVSDRLPSNGKSDIFVVDINPDGSFNKPRNLGNKINTSGEETTPYITEKNILYFSSNGHSGGAGNLDIFAAEVSDNYISDVYHLESPINSINDDFAFIIDKSSTHGFFTSNRLQGNDNLDMYAFTFEKEVNNDCYIIVEGFVKDKDSQELLEGAKVDLLTLQGEKINSISTGDDGLFNFEVPCNSEYKLVASTDNYKGKVQRIEILDHNYHRSLHTNFNLKRIKDIIDNVEKDEAVVRISPIFFDFDKYNIRSDSRPELDKIVRLMKDNPKIEVEAAAHTDSRGTHAYNKALSERRARAARKYIISQGIDPNRIFAKGYGEEKLLNHCVDGVKCTEEQHQQNRRTEFTIINTVSQTRTLRTIQESDTKNAIATTSKKAPKKAIVKEVKDDPVEKAAIQPVRSKTTQSVKLAENQSKIEKLNVKNNISPVTVKKEEPVTAQKVKAEPQVIKKETQVKTVKKPVKEQPAVAQNNVKKESYSNYEKTDNQAENYIQEQKIKVIDKLNALEHKFVAASRVDREMEDSFLEEKDKIVELKEEIIENKNIGWSNIIQYNNQIISFNKIYMRLMNEVDRSEQSSVKVKKDYEHSVKKNTDLKKAKKDIGSTEKLKINNVEVVAMKKNPSGKYAQTKSARKTDMIKVSFKILSNKNINPGRKQAYIVVENPDGKVTDARGVFTEKETKKQNKYTDHTVFNYNNNDVNVEMFIIKKGDFKKGVYPVKLFLEGQLVGSANLDLASGF
jgi:outer membrane protein OmpA-like peptidoglycan-associated protein